MLCKWDNVGGRLHCPKCGCDIPDRGNGYNPKHKCGGSTGDADPMDALAGVGACLLVINHKRYKIPPCQSCLDLAAQMDAMGPDECRANLADLAERFQSNAIQLASRPGWTQLLAAAMHPVSTTTGAIQAYREGLAFYERLILDACEMVESSTS